MSPRRFAVASWRAQPPASPLPCAGWMPTPSWAAPTLPPRQPPLPLWCRWARRRSERAATRPCWTLWPTSGLTLSVGGAQPGGTPLLSHHAVQCSSCAQLVHCPRKVRPPQQPRPAAGCGTCPALGRGLSWPPARRRAATARRDGPGLCFVPPLRPAVRPHARFINSSSSAARATRCTFLQILLGSCGGAPRWRRSAPRWQPTETRCCPSCLRWCAARRCWRAGWRRWCGR